MKAFGLVTAAVVLGSHWSCAQFMESLIECSAVDSASELQECAHGCAPADALPGVDDCAKTFCESQVNSSAYEGEIIEVNMIVDDGGYFTGVDHPINNFTNLCGCWIDTSSFPGAAISFNQSNGAACSGYDPTQEWSSTLFESEFPVGYFNSNPSKYCFQCADPPNTNPCENFTLYTWPQNFFVSQPGCLLNIVRDGHNVDPWPASFSDWIITNSTDNNGNILLTNRFYKSHTALFGNEVLTFFPTTEGVEPINLTAAPTVAPTAAPTPAGGFQCSIETGLHYIGDVLFETACKNWQPAYCKHRPDNAQCQCYCGVPQPSSEEEEVVHVLVWTVLSANSAVFVFSVAWLFFHLKSE